MYNLSSPDSNSLFFHAGYSPPTPPQKSGLHRYQFMLFEQPPDTPVSLTEPEKLSRGNDSTRAIGSIIYHIPTLINTTANS